MEPKPLLKLTILSWGGIGETLRNLAVIPHDPLYFVLGIRSHVVYQHSAKEKLAPGGEAPQPWILEDLITRIPSLVWEGDGGEHKGLSWLLNRTMRLLSKFFHGMKTPYYPFTIELTPEEEAALPKLIPGSPILGIHTHLSGTETKRWGFENWHQYLTKLIKTLPPEYRIILIDKNPQVQELCISPQISHTCGWNLAQSIRLAGRLDFLVSVHSWPIYAAAMYRKPQLIIVPDQTEVSPHLTAKELVSFDFDGFVNNEKITFIGLVKTHLGPELTLPSMADLSPDYLLEQTLQALQEQKLLFYW